MSNKAKVLLACAGLLVVLFACSALMSGGSKPESSKGAAEVACEHKVQDATGSKKVTYTHESEVSEGQFNLFGTVMTDNGSVKFQCQVSGAMTDGTPDVDLSIN